LKALATCALASGVLLVVAGSAAAQAPPAPPKPGPEHALFKDVAGTWDAKVEMWMGPGEPMVSAGEEMNEVGCGGLCLVTKFKSTMMNEPFEGRGMETWDPAKKKYVGSWSDSMSAGLMVTESTHDAATKTMTGWMEAPDMTGKMTKMKSTSVMKDPNTRVFSMYNVGPDGKENLGMRITYTRRK
jgi:hypothetical protein